MFFKILFVTAESPPLKKIPKRNLIQLRNKTIIKPRGRDTKIICLFYILFLLFIIHLFNTSSL